MASVATCYNTSWEWYSLDMCVKPDAAATSTIPAIAAATSATSSESATVSGGAIAGAVIGSVFGLGIIAVVSVYLFWFRPKQQKKKRGELIEAQRDAVNATASQMSGHLFAAAPKDAHGKVHEMHQLPSELSSPTNTAELPSAVVSEAPGDGGGFELHEDSHVVELPGDHHYRSS